MSAAVVMTGLAAAGKTTLGRALAPRLGFAFVDKDDHLERRFDDDAPFDPDVRVRLSRAADVEFAAAAHAAGDAVLVSFWRHRPEATTGTPLDLLHEFDPVIEVHCVCPPEVAIARFLNRRRHPQHGDSRWTLESGLANFRRVAALGPLGVGPLVSIDTHPWPTERRLDDLADEVATLLAASR